MAKKQKEKMTTSKKILWATYALFASQVFCALHFAYNTLDTSVFMYTIPSTAGLAGAATVFYLNKSKMENVFRFKISFLKFEILMKKKYPESAEEIEAEVSSIEDALSMKIDQTMQEAINEDITIQNY